MAYERISDDPYPTNPGNPDTRREVGLDNDLQADPELAEGPAGNSRIAVFAVAVAVILGAVFYGLNNSSLTQPGTSSTAQNTTQSSPPAAPPGMRDVTPRANTEPGVTTGAAPASPLTPPAASPPGSTVNRSGNNAGKD